MKLFKKIRINPIIITGIVTLCAVAATAVSTMAWFSHLNQSPTGGVVSGTPNLTVANITGYKNVLTPDSDGSLNQSTANVISYNAGTGESQHENTNLSDEDEAFDIPNAGVGYYMIKGIDGSFKSTDSNTFKLHDYKIGNDTHLYRAYSDSIALTQGDVLRFKHYHFANHETQYETIAINSPTTSDGKVVTNQSNDIVVTATGTANYKVWLDFTSGNTKVWLDYNSTSPTLGFETPVLKENLGFAEYDPSSSKESLDRRVEMPRRSIGTTRIYFDCSSASWWANDHVDNTDKGIKVYYWNGSNNGWANMKKLGSNANVFYADLESGSWTNFIFVRGKGSKWDGEWNRIETPHSISSSNTTFQTNSDGNGGSWTQKYGNLSEGYYIIGNSSVSGSAIYNDGWVFENALATTGAYEQNLASWRNITLKQNDVFKLIHVGSNYQVSKVTGTTDGWFGTGAMDNKSYSYVDGDGSGDSPNFKILADGIYDIYLNEHSKVYFNRRWTLNFNSQGGSEVSSRTLNQGHSGSDFKYGTLPSSTREGYVFDGWFKASSGGTAVSSSDNVDTSNLTLFAHWTPKSYNLIGSSGNGTVTFYSDSARTTSITSAAYGSTVYYSVTANTGYTAPANGSFTLVNGTSGLSFADIATANTNATLTLSASTANTYSVTFNRNWTSNDSTQVDESPIDETYDAKYTLPSSSPSRTGYEFAGWWTDRSEGTKITTDTDVAITAAQTLYAHWTPNTYDINYVLVPDNKDGPTVGNVTFESSQPTSFTYSDLSADKVTLVNVSDSTKTYSFKGWYTTPDCSGTAVTELTRNRADHYTLYAKWAQTYTVSFNPGNGGSGTIAPAEINKGDSYSLPTSTGFTAPTGYIFAGWNTSANGVAGTRLASGASVTPTENVVYYAQWKRTITLNKGDGTFDHSSYDHIYGINFSLSELSNPTLSGYTFAGWYDGEGTLVETLNNSTTSPLSARYSRTITFDSHGGSSIGNLIHVYGTSIDINVNSYTPSRNGHQFTGWYDASSSGNRFTLVSNSLTATTLHAYWQIVTYTISYSGVAGASFSSPNPTTYIITDTPITLNNPTKKGYTFIGWSGTNLSGTNNTSVTIPANSHENLEYTANWSADTFTVRFNAGEGSPTGSTASVTATYDSSVNLTNNGYSRTGYHFAGWAASSNGSIIYAYTGSPLSMDASKVNAAYDSAGGKGKTYDLYAIWTVNSYTVVFNGNGGEDGSEMDSQDFTYGVAQSLSANTFAKTGYSFLGWALTSQGSKAYDDKEEVNNLTAENEGTFNLYAVWQAINYEITFNTDGGTINTSSYGSSPYTYTIEAAKTLPTSSQIAKTGYTFAGWYANSDLTTGGSRTSVASGSTGNKTFWAKWTINYYTVTFLANGGSGSMDAQRFNYQESKNLTTNTFAYAGYTFAGWGTSSNAATHTYLDGYTVTADLVNITSSTGGNINLYAIWQSTITLDPGTGASSSGSTSVTVTKGQTMNNIAIPRKSGYSFRGYFAAENGSGTKYYNADGTGSRVNDLANSSVLYAYWVEKTTFDGGDIIYFIPNDNWKTDSAQFAVYFFNDETNNTWANMSEVTGAADTLYRVTVPVGNWSSLIFVRMNPSRSGNGWTWGSQRWNQSQDIAYTDFGDHNLYDDQNYPDSWTDSQKETERNNSGKTKDQNSDNAVGNDLNGVFRYYHATMPEADSTYYYFDNKSIWSGSTPAAYAWTTEHYVKTNGIAHAPWVGTNLTKVNVTIPGAPNVPYQYVWSITIPSIYDRLIFNKGAGASSANAGDQTIDLSLAQEVGPSETAGTVGHPGWFFVLTGSTISGGANDGKYNGVWASSIIPVQLHARYYLDTTLITEQVLDTGYSFGIEPYSPATTPATYYYYGDQTNGIGYRFYVGSSVVYHSSTACDDTDIFVPGTDSFSSLDGNFSDNNYHLYLKYTSSSSDYKTFYVDAKSSGNGGDNTRWTGIHVVYWDNYSEEPASSDTTHRHEFFFMDDQSSYYLTDYFYRITMHKDIVFAMDNQQGNYASSNSTVHNIGIGDTSDYLLIYENTSSLQCTYEWRALHDDDIGTAKIYISSDASNWGEAVATMGIGDLTTSNYFIYERGKKINKNDYVKVIVTNVDTTVAKNLSDGDYEWSKLINGNAGKNASYLVQDGTHIKIKIDDGRFTFYITTDGELAIAKVPYLGNGFYIMPTVANGSTDGYDDAVKMLTLSDTKASYDGFNVNNDGEYYYVRSYLNAKDYLYTTFNISSEISSNVSIVNDSEGNATIVYFAKKGTYSLEAKGTTLYISKFEVSAFFQLNGLDMDSIGDQPSIKGQNTTLVLEVALSMNNGASTQLKLSTVTNTLSSYVGYSFFVSTKSIAKMYEDGEILDNVSNPYDYMRANCYTLTTTGAITSSTIIPANTSSTVYAYILIDYAYSASLATMPYNPTGLIHFQLDLIG